MKKHKQLPLTSGLEKRIDAALIRKFGVDLQTAVERGETLDQLAERIDQENTPYFYGAEFRRAYSEGLAASSAYGYEQPLDLHDAQKMILGTWNPEAPEHIQGDMRIKNGFEEAEFEVMPSAFLCLREKAGMKRCSGGQCENCEFETMQRDMKKPGYKGCTVHREQHPYVFQLAEGGCLNPDMETKEDCEFIPPVWNEIEKCWQCSIYRVPGGFDVVENKLPMKLPNIEKERCPAEIAVENYFGLKGEVNETTPINTDFGQLVGLLYHFKENYLDKEDPGKDLIITPLGEMTFREWDLYLSGLPAERKQFEAPED